MNEIISHPGASASTFTTCLSWKQIHSDTILSVPGLGIMRIHKQSCPRRTPSWRRYYDQGDYLSGRWKNTEEPRLSHVTPPFQYQSQTATSSALLWIFRKGLVRAWRWPLSPIQQQKQNRTEKIVQVLRPMLWNFPGHYLLSPFWDFSFPISTMALSCSR